MKDERVDGKLRELLAAARPEVPEGWERRMRARLAKLARPIELVSQPHWAWRFAGVAVVLLALGVMPLSLRDTRNLRRVQASSGVSFVAVAEASEPAGEGEQKPPSSVRREEPDWYRAYAISFVTSHFPQDPQMLMAAGLLANNKQQGLQLLSKTAAQQNTPVFWAAYVKQLLHLGPKYRRPGNLTYNASLQNKEARVQRMNARDHLRDRLTPEEARPILAAVRAWQRVEPQNAYPVIEEMRALYGLHEGELALARWEAAARLPMTSSHPREINRAVAALVQAMGGRDLQLVWGAINTVTPRGSLDVQECGRIADYEAQHALAEQRPRDAVRWWKATADLGERIQQASDGEDVYFETGYLLARVGVAPSWQRILGGRRGFHYGPQHALFVSQLGEAADAEMRDRFIKSDQRVRLLMDARQCRGFMVGPYRGIHGFLTVGQMLIGMLLFLGVVYVLIVAFTAARRERYAPDGAMSGSRFLLAGLTVLPAVALTLVAWFGLPNRFVLRPAADQIASVVLCGGLLLTVLLAFLLPYRMARREQAVPRGVAWRAYSRQLLSVVIIVCAALSLCFWAGGKWQEQRAVKRLATTGTLEEPVTPRDIGPAWNNVTVPAGIWKAEYPPKKN